MIRSSKAAARFHTRLDWLDSRHSFSFANHYDPSRLGYGPLRVINEDWIAPRSGFPMHAHREMEILTYVLSGTLEHRDTEGNAVEVSRGRAQLMHAGTGIAHSELNQGTEPVHLLQIWLEPDVRRSTPGHEMLDHELRPGAPTVIASPAARAGGLAIRQDATLSALSLEPGQTHVWPRVAERAGWLQVAHGAGQLGELGFESGDGFMLEDVEAIELRATEPSELLLFDLPGLRPPISS